MKIGLNYWGDSDLPDQKENRDAKKAIEKKVKSLGEKVKNDKKLKKVCCEKKEIDDKKDKTPEDVSNLKRLKVDWDKIIANHQKAADRTSSDIVKMLKGSVPGDGSAAEAWKKDLAPWYRKMIESEPGLDLSKIGIPGRVSGEVSLDPGKEKATIKFSFKW